MGLFRYGLFKTINLLLGAMPWLMCYSSYYCVERSISGSISTFGNMSYYYLEAAFDIMQISLLNQ